MSNVQLGRVLQRAGFQPKRVHHGTQRGWLVYERTTDEINANRKLNAKMGTNDSWMGDGWQV